MTTSYWQQDDKASAFVDSRRSLIPLIAEQEDVVRFLLTQGREVERFLDLGSGAGAMSALVVEAFPRAHGVLADFSRPMLAQAGERFGEAHTLVEADMSDPAWLDAVGPSRFDLIVSGLAIHHLTDVRKRELFYELFELLEPGGLFVNLEHVQAGALGMDRVEQELVERIAGQASANGEDPDAAVACFKDTADEDILANPDVQVDWLSAAGFEAADQYFRWFDLAVIAARKPKGDI